MGEITNNPYLEYIASKGNDIVISTGMADLNEIELALQVIEKKGISRDRVTVLHCNIEFPTPIAEVNLFVRNHVAEELNVR